MPMALPRYLPGIFGGAAPSIVTFAIGALIARWNRIHETLYEKCREQAEREATPTAAIIDAQSVKSAEKGAWISSRY